MLHVFAGACALLVFLGWARAAGPPESAAPPQEARPLVIVGDEDYRPLSYLEHGTPTGMDVEMGEAVAAVLKRPARVELIEWERAQEKIRKGEADVILGMSVTEARKAEYDFSITPFEHEFAFFVRAGDIEVSGPADFAGKRVGVTEGGYPRTALETKPGFALVVVNGYQDGARPPEGGRDRRLRGGSLGGCLRDPGVPGPWRHGGGRSVREGALRDGRPER